MILVLVRACLLLALCAIAAPAVAQGTTGSISGFITDDTHAALPGATVTVRHIDTDQKRVVVTDGAGRFRAQELAPGRYEVAVELQGFRTARTPPFALTVGQDATVNLQMKVGGLDEQVTVTGEATQVNMRQSSVAMLVDEKQIRELPLNGRDFSQLTLLQPGVTASPSTQQQVDRGMGTQVSIAGARPNQISYQLDGTDANTQGNGSPGSAAGGLLGVETVREFQVLVNNYSAEYGRSTGGIVTAVTRSGTNAVRGTAFEFTRNSRFDSRTYFDDPSQDLPPLKRNQFGGILGGPIVKEKTFFFGSYEGLRQDRGVTTIATVPSRATRARTDISPVTLPYLMLYPEPNGRETGATGIYSVQITSPTHEDYAIGKIDHTLSPAHSLAVRYSWDKAQVDQDQPIPLWTTDTRTQSQSVVAEHKWIVRSNILNVLKAAWNRAYEATANIENVAFDPQLFFVPNTRFGNISVSGINALGPDTNTPTFVDLKSLQFIDNFTWARGSHNLKAGVSFTHYMNDQDSSFDYGGNYSFTSLENFLQNRPGTYEGQAPGSTTDRRWRQNLIGLYAQDDWSARRNLTLNLGVRYEFITTPHELSGRMASMPDLQAANTVSGGDIFKNPSLKNVAPRAGFAWDMTGDGRNALHGGAGLFFEPILGNVYRAYGNRTPPYYNLINPANPTFPTPPTSGTSSLLRLDLVEYGLKNPYRVQYNLTYQRELAGRTIVTGGFVGSRGYSQIRNVEYNQSIPIVQPDGSYFFPSATRRNPYFGSMRLRTSDGLSWYKGLIAGASRRFSGGVAMQASYTLGKSEDLGSQSIGSADFDNSFQPRYAFDRMDNLGPSDFDIRHNFAFNAMWEIPAGNLDGVAGAIAGGWQLSSILALRSGIPFTPVLGSDRARAAPRSGGAGQRPDLVSGCSLNPVLGGAEMYFDVNCFSLPAVGTFGNVPRNTITGPGFASWDMAFFKNIPFANGRRIQLRVEGFNLTNHVNFGLPQTTVFNASGRVANAGQITSIAGTARQWQFGAKVEF
jgi:Carboxypeptidase regulatory-like domain/TonB dependent receptor-like, beta-barrel/TonB-dependent Receptor Plug Domain